MELLADDTLEFKAQVDGCGETGAGLALVMDELAYGVLVSTPEGRLVHANQAARHELDRKRALLVDGGRLRPQRGQELQALQESLARAAQGKRSLLTLTAGSGPALPVAVVPLRANRDADPRVSHRQVGLLFARANVCDPLMLCFFARSHALTRTEEHVLGILCHGYSAPHVAQQMKVAVSTVRSHIRSLCNKTRTSGVRELVNRVAVLPPVAPAFWQHPMH